MESKLLFMFYIGHNSYDREGETEAFITGNHILLLQYHVNEEYIMYVSCFYFSDKV